MPGTTQSFSATQRVEHQQYGHGTIISSDERYTIVQFDQGGRKMFVTAMLQLTRSEVAAPAKKAPRTRKKAAAK